MCSSKSNIAPDSWKLQRIGQLAETYAGGTPPRNASGMFGGTIPWVKSAELNQREILDTDEKLTELGYQSSSVKWVPESTPLIAMYGATAGVVSWLKIRAVTNQAVLAVLPRNEDTDARWLYWALSFYSGKLLASVQGSGQPNLNKALIKQLEVICPPLPEQRCIAEILDTADEAIRQAERVIAKLQAVKAGLLHDLLTRGLDEHGHLRDPQAHPEQFKDSPLGRIPREWRIGTIDDLAINHDSKRIPAKQADREKMKGIYPYYGASGIIDWVDDFIFDGDFVLLGEDGENVVSRRLPLAFRVSGKLWVNNHAHVYEPLPGVDIRFLTEFLEATDYGPVISGSAQPKLTQDGLSRLRFKIPPSNEQKLIGDVLDTHDARIRAEEAALSKLRQVKRGLMDDLLTGRVRVT